MGGGKRMAIMEERKKRQEEAKKYEELKNKVSDLL